jgi:olfactory receptor
MLVKMALAILTRAVAMLTLAPILAKSLESFQTHIISYFYCAYMAVVMTACGDISGHIVCRLIVIVASVGFDLFFISLPYGLILQVSFTYHLQRLREKFSAHVALIFVSFVLFSYYLLCSGPDFRLPNCSPSIVPH